MIQVLELNIELEKESGSITGNVNSRTSGVAVENCLVIAYDQTDQAVGIGITDSAPKKISEKSATGKYDLSELVKSFMINGTANEYDGARYPFYLPIPYQRVIPYAAAPE